MTWFHHHRWKLNAVQHCQSFVVDRESGKRHCLGDVTRLLLICECGKAKTATIDGTWTINELQPKDTATDFDKTFMRSLNIKP